MIRRNRAFTLEEATQDSPTLARLTALVSDSNARLQAIQPLIPAAMRGVIKAGPVDGNTWCLLLDNNASAAKLRQLLPSLEACLRSRGWEVTSIRLKVQSTRTTGSRC